MCRFLCVSFPRIIKKQMRIERKERKKNFLKIKFPPYQERAIHLYWMWMISGPVGRIMRDERTSFLTFIHRECQSIVLTNSLRKVRLKNFRENCVFQEGESHRLRFSPQVNCLSVLCGIYAVKAYSFSSLWREMLQASADHPSAVREELRWIQRPGHRNKRITGNGLKPQSSGLAHISTWCVWTHQDSSLLWPSPVNLISFLTTAGIASPSKKWSDYVFTAHLSVHEDSSRKEWSWQRKRWCLSVSLTAALKSCPEMNSALSLHLGQTWQMQTLWKMASNSASGWTSVAQRMFSTTVVTDVNPPWLVKAAGNPYTDRGKKGPRQTVVAFMNNISL